jgi:hypothetical protein
MLRGGEDRERPLVTLPRISFLYQPDAIEIEAAEAAAKVGRERTIRAGLDAWASIQKAESFDGWKRIGAALAIGRTHALRLTGANRPMGRTYSLAFNSWIREHRFDSMAKPVRSWALALNENLDAIEEWRRALSDRDRRRLVNPQSVVKRWQRATAQPPAKPADDPAQAAAQAWRRFVACVEALPPDQAAPFWQLAQAQAGALLDATLNGANLTKFLSRVFLPAHPSRNPDRQRADSGPLEQVQSAVTP